MRFGILSAFNPFSGLFERRVYGWVYVYAFDLNKLANAEGDKGRALIVTKLQRNLWVCGRIW